MAGADAEGLEGHSLTVELRRGDEVVANRTYQMPADGTFNVSSGDYDIAVFIDGEPQPIFSQPYYEWRPTDCTSELFVIVRGLDDVVVNKSNC